MGDGEAYFGDEAVEPEFIRTATWSDSVEYAGLHELKTADGTLLAWVQARPHYCDRGHYQANLEFSPGNPFDASDGLPCYYMRLDVAMREVVEKLLWRCCKIRTES